MIIATNHEHTHKTSQGSCKNAAAKVKLSFFVSLHLFQFCAKKLLYNFTTASRQQQSLRVCVPHQINPHAGVIKFSDSG
jgi:hypothetical protein